MLNVKKNRIRSFHFLQLIVCILLTSLLAYSIVENNRNHTRISYLSKSDLQWPPLKVFAYPNNSRHTSECLYPSDFPTRYITENGFWFQRMLEPTVHEQLLASPMLTSDPNDADLFYIPHYSRMCSGFNPPEERWDELPDYLEHYGDYFTRYSNVDHFLMHSVPHYGDKHADLAIDDSRQPIIGVLDFKWSEMIKKPWTYAKSQILPFITLKSKINPKAKRTIPVFVAMSTNHLAKNSANLRKNLSEIFKKIKNSEFIKISRTSPKSVRDVLSILPTKMGSSDFCIIPPGDAPTSKRLFDAISHLCIPLIVADYITLPFDGTSINYTQCVLQIPSKDIEKIPDLVNNFDKNKIKEMRKKLETVREMFIWDYKNPPVAGQAFWNFAWNLYYKSEMMKPYRNSEMTGYDNDPPTILF